MVRKYEGLARSARCQDEVLSLMDDVAAALGVDCEYCHQRQDYPADTRRKQIANWMATELATRVAAKSHRGPVACPDCHARGAKPVAKLLGSPRTESHAIEWMTTELVENFTQSDGKPLRCRTCHRDNLGGVEFRRRLLLTDALSELPKGTWP